MGNQPQIQTNKNIVYNDQSDLVKVSLLIEQAGKLKGPFRGFNNQQTRFTFSNGAVWRQNENKYFYFYAANPRAQVIYKNGVYLLEVDGTDEVVEVVKEVKK